MYVTPPVYKHLAWYFSQAGGYKAAPRCVAGIEDI